MGTLWTDVRLWPTELDQNQNSSKEGFQESQATLQTGIPQARRTRRESKEKGFALGVATIITIFVSAIYLICHYLF